MIIRPVCRREYVSLPNAVLNDQRLSAEARAIQQVRDAGWKTRRFIPFDDMEWIKTEWFFALRRAIVGPVKTNSSPGGRS